MKYFLMIISFISFNLLADVDLNLIEKQLTTTGLKGEIHGAINDAKLFVITYRNPENFFENIQLPLTSEDPAILESFTKIKRHQYYIVKGSFVESKAPIKHINVKSMELDRDYTSELDHMPYTYKGDVMDLLKLKEFVGRVHAVGENGKMLVMEYKDRIMPVFVTEPATQLLVNNLYRGDLVKVKFYVRGEPEAPTHLSLQRQSQLGANEKALEVIESLVSHHGESVTKSGVLVKFPKSPQINTNIYALLVEDSTGGSMQFTITNLENPEVFKAAREKIEKFWDANTSGIQNDRNKFINRKIIVTAKGTYNMIDKGQANPQILVNSADDVTLELK